MGTIAVATDGSDTGTLALREAVALARDTGDELLLVSVVHPQSIVPMLGYDAFAGVAAVDPQLEAEVAHAAKEHAEDVLRRAAEVAAEAGVTARIALRDGEPGPEICAAAAEAEARLIVVGSHGYGALSRLVFGSVSTKVLHDADRPVLVVRGAVEPAES